MFLNEKSIEVLGNLIAEDIEYRSGPQLIDFFSEFGFNDVYGQGFPSRWYYTQQKLNKINGTANMDKCIKKLFSPINFIGQQDKLHKFVDKFNDYLMFDGWKLIIKGKYVKFIKVNDDDWNVYNTTEIDVTESEFMKLDVAYDIDKLSLDSNMKKIIEERIDEMDKCIENNIPLAAIFLSGSTLEGILLNNALDHPQLYMSASSSPKVEGKVKKISNWSLKDLIDVSAEIGFVQQDVKKFSHVLRNFRNYIHPFQQNLEKFSPSTDTSKICSQVLRLAINQLSLISSAK